MSIYDFKVKAQDGSEAALSDADQLAKAVRDL